MAEAYETAADSGPAFPGRDSFHRIQRTGNSSLTVTLPKAWVEAMRLGPGDVVRLRDLGAGRVEITPTPQDERHRTEEKLLPVEMNEVASGLLPRLLIGAYVTGQDRIVLHLKGGFDRDERSQIDRTVRRILGMSIVGETADRLDVQVFVDPTRHALAQLRGRTVNLLRAELALVRRVLAGGRPSNPAEFELLEEEIDRIYFFSVRQLLLASDDFRIAREIGVPSHHYQIGDRLVAKVLEMIGDLLFDTGRSLMAAPGRGRKVPEAVRVLMDDLLGRLDHLLAQTMEAFSRSSLERTNATLNELLSEIEDQPTFGRLLSRRFADPRLAMLVQRFASNLLTAWEMLVAVNEVAFNRDVEPETLAGSGTDALRVNPHPTGP